MHVIEGELKMLGASKILEGGRIYKYSNIEIGDKMLKNLSTYSALTGFLERALNMNGNTKLFIVGQGICAVELPDGKRYYLRSPFGLLRGIFTMLFGVCMLPIFLIGLLPLWNGINLIREWKASIEVYTPTAIAVN